MARETKDGSVVRARAFVAAGVVVTALVASCGGSTGEGPTTTRQRNSALPVDSAVDTTLPGSDTTAVPSTDPSATTAPPETDPPVALPEGTSAAVALAPEHVKDGDEFAGGVVVSSDGSTLVVSSARSEGGRGSVTVYARSGDKWAEQDVLRAGDAKAKDWFGYSMAVSADGNTVAVGSVYADAEGLADSGSVSVFGRDGGKWSLAATLTAAKPAEGDIFGVALSLSSDGSSLAVGASGADGGKRNSGAAYVFTRAGGWADAVTLLPTEPTVDGNFGATVSLAGDGATLAVGGPSGGTGRVYVFVSSAGKWS